MCVGRSWNGCRRPVVISERSYMGVKDSRYYLKRFCTGVRDPRYYPKSSIWVLETRGEIRKVLLLKRKHTVMFIT